MVVIGVVGVLALPLVFMVSACGKILEGGGTPYLDSLYMILEMVQKCCFGLIVGADPLLSLTAILNYIGLAVAKRQIGRAHV